MSDTYSWVDRGDNPVEAADWQDRVNSWPAIAAYKLHSRELLRGRAPVLDVGCGTGTDLGEQHGWIGVDRSSLMLERASATGRPVARADAVRLPFTTGCFDGVRADRVVQHLEDPHRALGELARVLALHGTMVVVDPDQSTLRIELPWAPPDLVERVRLRRRDVMYRNGMFVRHVAPALAHIGFDRIAVDEFPLELTDIDDAFGLPTWVDGGHRLGAFSDVDVLQWHDAVERARAEPGFRYTVTYSVVSGQSSRR